VEAAEVVEVEAVSHPVVVDSRPVEAAVVVELLVVGVVAGVVAVVDVVGVAVVAEWVAVRKWLLRHIDTRAYSSHVAKRTHC